MSDPVLVAGSEGTIWTKVLRIVGGLGLTAGLTLQLMGHGWGWIVLVDAGVVFVTNEVIYFFQLRNRRWVQDTGVGIVVTDRIGEFQWSDEQIAAMSFHVEDKYHNGVKKSQLRHFAVWSDSRPDPVRMTNRITVGDADPLADLIDRIVTSLKTRSEAALHAGGAVVGDGWQLRGQILSIESSGANEELPLTHIEAIDVFENQVSIWRQGEAKAEIRFPVSGRNAHLLLLLVSDQVNKRDQQAPPKQPPDDLGRIMFEKRPSRLTLNLVISLGMLLISGGLTLLATLDWDDVGILSLCLIGVGLLLALGGGSALPNVFRCHQYGVFKRSLFGSRQLRYEDVASFTYSATRHYYNGAYTGTQFSFSFVPSTEVGGKSVVYNTQLKQDDDDLDVLRDHISQVIASRMAETLAAGQPVPWTPNLTFQNDGLEHVPSGWFGNKDPIFVPYQTVHAFDVQEGHFYLWINETDKPIIQEPCTQPNFYPGFLLLVEMFSEERDEGEPAPASEPQ